MATRIQIGDVRGDWVVLSKANRGEVILGHHTSPGIAHAKETRTLDYVRSIPRSGRCRVSRRDAGGYYIAEWIGRAPRLHTESEASC